MHIHPASSPQAVKSASEYFFQCVNRNHPANLENSVYDPSIVRGPWVNWALNNPVPLKYLDLSLDPFVRRVLSLWALSRSRDRSRNLGFGFAV